MQTGVKAEPMTATLSRKRRKASSFADAMALDQYITAQANLNSDRFQERIRRHKYWENKQLALALLFFSLHPSPAPTIMNLRDFKAEHPEFGVNTIPNLKGLRTQLKKKGVL